MMIALEIVVAIGVLVGLAVVVLRARKLLRVREQRQSSESPRLISPPPSPYASSKGFRLINGDGSPSPRPLPNRPRLDPNRHYVFGDQPVGDGDDVVPSLARHDQEWLLHRSSHRSSIPSAGVIGIVVVLVLIVASLVIFFRHHATPSRPTTTSTTSLSIGAGTRGGVATASYRWTLTSPTTVH